VSRILEPEMTAEEGQALERSADVLRSAVERMNQAAGQRGVA
jgi:hypothetical protein